MSDEEITQDEMWAWIEKNRVEKKQGLWEAHSYAHFFTVSRVTLKDAVFAAMVVERLLQERGI